MRLRTSWRDGLDKPSIYLSGLEILWRGMQRRVRFPGSDVSRSSASSRVSALGLMQ